MARPPKLGEQLVAAGVLTVAQVQQALRAQVMWGGRLGTNLVELHFLELDPLSSALSRQHRLPAALSRHFEKADRELQRKLSPELAERLSCVPLLRMGPDQHVVIATQGPLSTRQLQQIATELAVPPRQLLLAVAAELRIRYQLERVFQVRRAARFLRARGKSIPPFPAFQILPAPPEPEADLAISLPTATREIELFRLPDEPAPAPPDEPAPPPPPPTARAEDSAELEILTIVEPDDDEPLDIEVEITVDEPAAELDDDRRPATLDDDLSVASEPAPTEDEAAGRERRSYVRTIADPGDDRALLGRIAIRKIAIGSAPRIMAGATLGEATRAIRRSTGRDRVADLVIDSLDRFAPACEAAILLVVRGETAIGWKGFQRTGGVLGEIAVPLEDGGLVPRAVEHNAVVRRPCGELDAIDRLLLGSLGPPDRDLVVVPIAIASQVMCVIAMAAAAGAPVPSAEPIAAAASAAFTRLIRDASR